MNGPSPSTRAFLADIPSLPADSKVRFLGCVKTYNISTGRLVLEHNYPRTKKPKQPKQDPPSVSVDVNAVLETVTWEELCVGAWVNVIGYVRREPGQNLGGEPSDSVYVDAVVVFPAGAVDLGEYERILCDLLLVERMRARE
ncbi:nuclear telomere cap complex subunit Ten1 [Aspergillus foveolatus]|uniref:nuclear telomere cap complex subunit Ten1 n=1 Tax=Aspergillus foveolatus TaxID=210207 RepID=UPI003CCDF20E